MGTVLVQFQLDLLASGDNVQSSTSIASNSSGFYEVAAVVLASGYNSIPVPSWSSGVQIIPPAANTEGLILKGATGDTGIPIAINVPTGPIVWPIAGPPATIGITAAGATSEPTFFRFF
jgi:hypothetical protein